MRTARRSMLVACIGVIAAFVGGCPEPRRELRPLPLVNTTDLEPSVRSAAARAQAQFDRVAQGKPKSAQLAEAYGELAMTYQAQSLVAPAEAAYVATEITASGRASRRI